MLRSTATKREAKQYISRYNQTLLDRPSSWVFENDEINETNVLRAAVVKIRDVKSIEPKTLSAIGGTIKRLSRLGLSPVVVVDAGKERSDFLNLDNEPFRIYQKAITWKTSLIAQAIEANEGKARPLDSAFDLAHSGVSGKTSLQLTNPELIKNPIDQHVVPVVAPIAFDTASGSEVLITADDAVFSIVKELQGKRVNNQTKIAFDKIIFIDPLGGVPSVERGSGASHVYVNLAQELDEISAELRIGFLTPKHRQIHLDNLEAMNKILSVLPVSSSGLITTPAVASLSTSKNPIIYNILTDRPIVSPSLPVHLKKTPVIETTILRKGVLVKIMFSHTGLSLRKEHEDGNIDLDRLQKLIEASFRKKIDMNDYLDRVDNKVAAIIIAGDYDGAAIITWETPAPTDKMLNFQQLIRDATPDSFPESGQRVAYLDKFAVEPSSQGGAGIADIIFKAMVMRLFPEELVWRSRKSNPVNKWYFERSKGTIKIPDSNWVMFYTGSNTREKTNLEDYLDVCQKIEPSFKD